MTLITPQSPHSDFTKSPENKFERPRHPLPGPPEMSVYSSEKSDAPAFDIRRTVDTVFLKLYPANEEAKPVAMMLRCLYKLNAEMFVVSGGIHNNLDGTKTYISVRMYSDKANYSNLHIYGSRRQNRFIVSSMEMYSFKQVITFDYTPRPIMEGGGGGGRSNGW